MTDDPHRVKFRVAPVGRALLVEIRVPLSPLAITPDHIDTINAGLTEACALITLSRDTVAAELAAKGICPWCGEVPSQAQGAHHACGQL